METEIYVAERQVTEQSLQESEQRYNRLLASTAGSTYLFLPAAAKKEEVSSRSGRIGGLSFLAKPVDLPELVDCIEKHLGKQASLPS